MGNDFNINDENSRVITNDRFFFNSKALFIKYEDILGLPWFTYISIMRSNSEKLGNILNLEPLKHASLQDLLLWYTGRKNENPIYELMKDRSVEKEKIDEFLYHEMENPKAYMLFNTFYEFMTIPDVLDRIVQNKFVDQIFIYSKRENPNIKRLIDERYKGSVYLHGDLETALKEVPDDSTYITDLSISFFDTLIKLDKLNFSSIACPIEYWYNGTPDKVIEYTETLSHKFIFKFHMLNVIR